MTDAVDTPEYHTSRLAVLWQELFFHRERQKIVATDPGLTADDRAWNLAYHNWIIKRPRQQLLDPEGH